MGQQQTLLILIGVIIVGIMIAFGVYMFRDQAAASNRDNVTTDLLRLGSSAQQYYRRPATLGGGERTFNGLTMKTLSSKASGTTLIDENGSFSLTQDPVSGSPVRVTLVGLGKETGLDGTNSVKVTMHVYPDSMVVDLSGGNKN